MAGDDATTMTRTDAKLEDEKLSVVPDEKRTESTEEIDLAAETGVDATGSNVAHVPADAGVPSALDEAKIPSADNSHVLDSVDAVSPHGGIGYDTVDLDGPDVDLLDEGALEGNVLIGGLDGRNDAVDGATQSSPDDQPSQGGDKTDFVGNQSTHNFNMEAVNKILNDSSLSEQEKQEKLDSLGDRIKQANDAVANGESSGGSAENADEAAAGEGAAPPAPGGGKTPDDDADSEGGFFSKVIDYVVEAAGYDSSKFWGDAGDAGSKGGLIGGQSLPEGVEGLDDVGTKKVLEARADAEESVRENDADTTAPAAPLTQDLGEEAGLGGPDPWADFTEQYHDQNLDGRLGSDIDFGDQVDGHASDVGIVDAETYTGSFDEHYSSPTEDQLAAAEAAIDTTPDEEFFEV